MRLCRPTPKKGKVMLFKFSDEELEYVRHVNTCLETKCKFELLRTQELGKNTHKHSELQVALTKPPALKRPTQAKLPKKNSTVLLLDYGGRKHKDYAVFI